MTTKRINPKARRSRAGQRRLLRWHWFTTVDGEFGVQARTANGEIVFSSTEGYKRLRRAVDNAALFGCPTSLRAVAEGVRMTAWSAGAP